MFSIEWGRAPVIAPTTGAARLVTPAVGPWSRRPTTAQLAASLAAAVSRAVAEGWKQTKGPAAEVYARDNFSVVRQVSELLAAVDQLTARPNTRVDA